MKASNNEGGSASGTWAIGWIHAPATKGWGEGWLCETERERERSSFFSVHVLNPPPLRYRGGSRQSTGPRRERRGGPRRSAGAPTSVSYHAKGGSRGRADHRATASKCANTHGSEGGGQPDGSLGKSTPENTGLRGPTTPANHPRTKIRILHAPPYRNQKAKILTVQKWLILKELARQSNSRIEAEISHGCPASDAHAENEGRLASSQRLWMLVVPEAHVAEAQVERGQGRHGPQVAELVHADTPTKQEPFAVAIPVNARPSRSNSEGLLLRMGVCKFL